MASKKESGWRGGGGQTFKARKYDTQRLQPNGMVIVFVVSLKWNMKAMLF